MINDQLTETIFISEYKQEKHMLKRTLMSNLSCVCDTHTFIFDDTMTFETYRSVLTKTNTGLH